MSLNTSNSGTGSAPNIGGHSQSPVVPSELSLTPEQKIEETLTVCYALANICQTSQAYALRVFNNNLTDIMLQLIGSKNVDVTRQALRCISAMCGVLNSSSEHVGHGSTRKRKAHMYADVLSALSLALKVCQAYVYFSMP